MPKVVVDTSKAESTGGFSNYEGTKPPPGLYKAVFKSAWWGKSKGGTPMLICVFELKAKNPDKAKYDGYAIWNRITHQESTLWRMQQLFVALGQPKKAAINISEKDGPFGKVVTSIGRAQVGKVELLIKAKDEKYEGNVRLGVDSMTPLPDTEVVDEEFNDDDDEPETSFEDSRTLTDGWVKAGGNDGVDPTDEKWEQEDEVPF